MAWFPFGFPLKSFQGRVSLKAHPVDQILEAFRLPLFGSLASNGQPLNVDPRLILPQLPKADLLTFWFARFCSFLVEVPKG